MHQKYNIKVKFYFAERNGKVLQVKTINFSLKTAFNVALFLIFYFLFPIFYFLFSIFYFQFPIFYFQFSIFYFLFSISNFQFSIFYFQFPIFYFLFSTFYFLFSIFFRTITVWLQTCEPAQSLARELIWRHFQLTFPGKIYFYSAMERVDESLYVLLLGR